MHTQVNEGVVNSTRQVANDNADFYIADKSAPWTICDGARIESCFFSTDVQSKSTKHAGEVAHIARPGS